MDNSVGWGIEHHSVLMCCRTFISTVNCSIPHPRPDHMILSWCHILDWSPMRLYLTCQRYQIVGVFATVYSSPPPASHRQIWADLAVDKKPCWGQPTVHWPGPVTMESEESLPGHLLSHFPKFQLNRHLHLHYDFQDWCFNYKPFWI